MCHNTAGFLWTINLYLKIELCRHGSSLESLSNYWKLKTLLKSSKPACLQKYFHGRLLSIRVFSSDGHYLNKRVFLSRNYRLIVAPRKFDVLKTNICPRREASRANMLVLRTSNFQGATIRPIVPRHLNSLPNLRKNYKNIAFPGRPTATVL